MKQIKAQLLMAIVADDFRVPVGEMKGSDRRANTVLARRVAVYLCRECIGMRFGEITDLFGIHPSTTILCYRDMEIRLNDEDPKYDELRGRVMDLIRKINRAWEKLE